MKYIILKSGKEIEYRNGFLTPDGMEIIVDKPNLSTEERREFRREIGYDQGTPHHLIFFGPTSSLLSLIFS